MSVPATPSHRVDEVPLSEQEAERLASRIKPSWSDDLDGPIIETEPLREALPDFSRILSDAAPDDITEPRGYQPLRRRSERPGFDSAFPPGQAESLGDAGTAHAGHDAVLADEELRLSGLPRRGAVPPFAKLMFAGLAMAATGIVLVLWPKDDGEIPYEGDLGGISAPSVSAPAALPAVPTQAVPTQAVPTQAVPTQAVPTQAVPTQAVPPPAAEPAAIPADPPQEVEPVRAAPALPAPAKPTTALAGNAPRPTLAKPANKPAAAPPATTKPANKPAASKPADPPKSDVAIIRETPF